MLLCAILLAGCSRSKPAPAAPPEAETASIIAMELSAQQQVGLQVAPAPFVRLSEHLQVTGTVQPVNSRVGEIRPLARGRILDVAVRVGDRVTAGQVLAQFDNMEAGELLGQLAVARSEVLRLKIQLAAQTRLAERNRELVDIGAMARRTYEQNRAEQDAIEESVRAQESAVSSLAARLERYGVSGHAPRSAVVAPVRAPFSGVVTKVNVAPGATVDSTTELIRVVDISEVWVQAEVYEKDLARVRLGETARILVDTYPDTPFHGRITYISDALDPQTRTAKVRCEVPNPAHRLKLDMFATIQLPTTYSRDTVVLPTSAIQQLEGKDVVFVRVAPARFEIRAIRAGKSVDGKVEIQSGVRRGEPVVVDGSFHLKSIVAGKDLGE